MEFYTEEYLREDGTPVLKNGEPVVREFYRFPLPLLPGRETPSFQVGLVDEEIKKQHAKEYAAWKNPVVVPTESFDIASLLDEPKTEDTVITQTTNPTIDFSGQQES